MNIKYLALILNMLPCQTSSSKTKLVNLKKLIPNIEVDLIYATPNNFTKKQIYSKNAQAYLMPEAAKALAKVQAELNKKGLGLKIWDAYRPHPEQFKLFKVCPNPMYVADPRKKGSVHSRGYAVDLTIINLKTNQELDMGTEFDDFSEKAHTGYTKLSKQVLKNRKLLRNLMIKQSFKTIKSEWWHFFYKDSETKPLLSIKFIDLD